VPMTVETIPNDVFRQVRLAMRLSQEELAKAVREAGERSGEPNDCSKRQIQRWEAGEVAAPRAVYVRALEMATGRPIESLGFPGAAEAYGTTRRQVMGLGLGAALMIPDSRGDGSHSGPLTGIWLSRYEYESSGRGGQTFASSHYCVLIQRGDKLQLRSLPNTAASKVSMDLAASGNMVTGNWNEVTDPKGYYQGATYYGAIQFSVDPTGHRMSGKWVGFGRDYEMNTGPWTLELVSTDVSDKSMAEFDRPVEDDS
jgi:transcriptional regulator with XRE-family HTH domain